MTTELDGLPAPTETFELPEGWYLLWCNNCGYSITFDEDTVASYGAEEWFSVLDWASKDHPCTPPLVIDEELL